VSRSRRVSFSATSSVRKIDFGGGHGFGVLYAILEAVKRGALGIVAHRGLRARRFAEGNAAPMAGDKQIALGFRFVEFLFEFHERPLQCFDLQLLVVHLFAKALRHPLRSLEAVQRGAGQIILALVHRDFRFAHPILAGFIVLPPLFFQHVLVGDGHGHLCLDL